MPSDPAFLTRRHAGIAALALAVTPLDVRSASERKPLSPMLATVYTGQVDPHLCLVSEKYDGVRAVWDGRVMRHRSGRTVTAPAGFLAALPDVPLDGELWLGRGRFDALSGIVRRATPRVDEWAGVRYVVFDLPGGEGAFADRAARLAGLVARAGARHLVAAPQMRVDSAEALRRRLDATVVGGGEGLMLHVAAAIWAPGRSEALMKLKEHRDAEAVVVGYRPGAGKYSGQIGAIEVQGAGGRRFLVGSGLSDALRRDPPALGDVVTYRYRDLTSSGLPRFATFLRRHDAF